MWLKSYPNANKIFNSSLCDNDSLLSQKGPHILIRATPKHCPLHRLYAPNLTKPGPSWHVLMLVNNLILPYDYHNHQIFYPGRTNFLSLRAKSLTRFVITEIKQQMVGTDITTQNVQRGGGGGKFVSIQPSCSFVVHQRVSVFAAG